MRLKEELVRAMVRRLEEDEELSYDEVVDMIVDNMGFSQILTLLKEYKDEDLEEELKAIIYERLYSDLEEKYTKKHKSIF